MVPLCNYKGAGQRGWFLSFEDIVHLIKQLTFLCGRLNESGPQTHKFEHFLSSCWDCLGRIDEGGVTGVAEVSKTFPVPTVSLPAFWVCLRI